MTFHLIYIFADRSGFRCLREGSCFTIIGYMKQGAEAAAEECGGGKFFIAATDESEECPINDLYP